MTALDRQVLNEKYVSCPIFSEGSQFLISKKNLAEEAMFKCEDEKYEMDMLLARAEVAIDAMTMQFEKLSCANENGQHCTWEDASLHRLIVTKYGPYAVRQNDCFEFRRILLFGFTKLFTLIVQCVLQALHRKCTHHHGSLNQKSSLHHTDGLGSVCAGFEFSFSALMPYIVRFEIISSA